MARGTCGAAPARTAPRSDEAGPVSAPEAHGTASAAERRNTCDTIIPYIFFKSFFIHSQGCLQIHRYTHIHYIVL